MLILGVDPGLRGAAAFYDGAAMRIEDIPVLPVRRSGKVRSEIDGYALSRIVDAAGHIDRAAIELVGAMPTDGPVQAGAFMKAFGLIIGIIQSHFIPLDFVAPVKWRRAMCVPPSVKGDKAPAIARATALLPQHSSAWAAVRGNGDAATRSGRAEAALIAIWLWRQVQGETAATRPIEQSPLAP